MTIDDALELLKNMKAKHGNVEVLFDCQYCGKSTKPDKLVAMIVITGDK